MDLPYWRRFIGLVASCWPSRLSVVLDIDGALVIARTVGS